MDVAGQQRGLAGTARAREDATLQEFQNFHALGARRCHRLVVRRM